MSHLYAVSQGNLTGWSTIIRYGLNSAIVNASVPESVWTGGGSFPWKPAAGLLEIVSSSASDTVAGVGARTIFLDGVDGNWARQTEVVTLNGTTAVPTVKSWFRVNTFVVTSAGTSSTNVGTITLRDIGAGATRDLIQPNVGINQTICYSIPDGHDLFINLFAAGYSDTATGDNPVIIQSYQMNWTTNVLIQNLRFKIRGGDTPYHHTANPPIRYGPRTDYCWNVVDKSGGASVGVFVYWSGCLVQNNAVSSPKW